MKYGKQQVNKPTRDEVIYRIGRINIQLEDTLTQAEGMEEQISLTIKKAINTLQATQVKRFICDECAHHIEGLPYIYRNENLCKACYEKLKGQEEE